MPPPSSPVVAIVYIIQGVAPKKHKEGSVHKLFMLLVVPDIQELYSNLKILLDELGLDKLDFVITSHLKIGNKHFFLIYLVILEALKTEANY